MKTQVELEFTPNPDTLKYLVNKSILAKGALELKSKEEAEEKSGLASALFEIPEIKSVMLGTNFVTVTLSDQEQMNELNDKMMGRIRDYLDSGKPVVEAGALQSDQDMSQYSEVELKIIEVLDSEVRPAVAMDGGDITFEKYEDGFVFLKMQGSCSGCPSSLMTLKMGVESRLRDAVPDIKEVVPV